MKFFKCRLYLLCTNHFKVLSARNEKSECLVIDSGRWLLGTFFRHFSVIVACLMTWISKYKCCSSTILAISLFKPPWTQVTVCSHGSFKLHLFSTSKSQIPLHTFPHLGHIVSVLVTSCTDLACNFQGRNVFASNVPFCLISLCVCCHHISFELWGYPTIN